MDPSSGSKSVPISVKCIGASMVLSCLGDPISLEEGRNLIALLDDLRPGFID
jgi:hypothetical protein